GAVPEQPAAEALPDLLEAQMQRAYGNAEAGRDHLGRQVRVVQLLTAEGEHGFEHQFGREPIRRRIPRGFQGHQIAEIVREQHRFAFADGLPLVGEQPQMPAREVDERRRGDDLSTWARTQPGRARIDHRVRNDRDGPADRFRKRDAEWKPSVDDRDLVGLERKRLVALTEMASPVPVQRDDVIVFWRARDMLAVTHEFMAGAVERGGPQIAPTAAP